jgi:hypothetical protein
MWKAPLSKANWLWLVCSVILYAGVYLWYLQGLKVQQYPGPLVDPFRYFGIVSFGLVVMVAAYSLRRRFVRVLPGKVQDWLWLHTWFGVIAILIAFLHVNYDNVLKNFYIAFPTTFIEAAGGTSALYSLFALVLSAVIGRFLDLWQARVIAREASSNGIGIVQSVEQHIKGLDRTIERLSAGKSAQFKQYCTQALKGAAISPELASTLAPQERGDFQHACEVFVKRAHATGSLGRQKRARFIIQAWRYVHIPLACIALAIIGIHSSVELLKMLLQLLGKG